MEGNAKKKQARIIPTPISMTFRVFGMHPCTYDPSTQHYSVRWCSTPVIHTILNLVWFSLLLITSCFGMARLFSYPDFLKDSGSDEMQLLGVLIIVGCLLNAWVNVLSRLILWRPFCDFFNKWRDLASTTDLNPYRHVGIILSVYIAFLICFLGVIGTVVMLGSSSLFLATVDLLARVLLMVREEWLVGTRGQVRVKGHEQKYEAVRYMLVRYEGVLAALRPSPLPARCCMPWWAWWSSRCTWSTSWHSSSSSPLATSSKTRWRLGAHTCH